MNDARVMQQTFAQPVQAIDPEDSARYGGKATGLARMAAAGIPVPPAFVIGTDGYRAFRAAGALPAAIVEQAEAQLSRLEEATGRRFGATDAMPLLVSVRSGAQISMPGMMDTVLNLGITAGGAFAMARETGNAGFALDTWMRFWRMFCDIVLDLDGDGLARELADEMEQARQNGTLEAFEALERSALAAIADQGADEVRADPHWQLQRAIGAVFESWDSRRARAYRSHHKIADDLGTAVTVQAMVFGNLDAHSGSGVAFTRDPNTGEARLYGEFMACRQGEDLVSGTATPASLAEPGALSERHASELLAHGQQLERMYRDAVDIEFTVEGAQLYFLQVRAAKRTAQAAVRIAAELVDDGILTPAAALQKVSIEQLKRLLRPSFEPAALAEAKVLTEGIGASPGHSYGVAVLDSDRAASAAASGQRVVLLRPTTSPQDIRGMLASQAIVTARGGALSHAAVVSRALDLPCVVGCEGMEIEPEARRFTVAGQVFDEGAPLSVDGATGRVYSGVLPLESAAHAVGHIDRILEWSDASSQLRFWIAGVNGGDARSALRQGPEGLGVIALTDLFITAGTVNELIAAIDDLGHQPDDRQVHERLARMTYDACRQLMLESSGAPIDIRLPNLGSPRAQRLISTWASLAPRLFLPLGMKGLYGSLLRGIADAARETAHARITPLAAAVTGVEEFAAFRRAAADVGLSRVGVVLQSPAGLAAALALAREQAVLWIDIRELIRTWYGYPSALSFGDEVFEDYLADGYLGYNPRSTLGPQLGQSLRELAASVTAIGGIRLGIECGDGTSMSLLEDLYRTGLRTFSAPAPTTAGLRLGLGQLAARSTSP